MPWTLAEAADLWWRHLPDRLRRRSPWLARVWQDGDALARWPAVALALPVLAALFGLLEGWSHWSPLTLWEYRSGARTAVAFVQMVPLLAVTVVAGSLSAQLGLLLTAGFGVGDLLLAPAAWSHPGLSMTGLLFRVSLPKLIALLLLFLLAVQPILMARRLAGDLAAGQRRGIRLPFRTDVALVAALQAGLVFAWTQIAPVVVRPFWMWAWHGEFPPLTVPYFAHVVDPGLPILAVLAVLLRAVLLGRVGFGSGVPVAMPDPAAPTTSGTTSLRDRVGILLSAAFATAMLGGFVRTPWLGLLLFVLMATMLVARAELLPRLKGWRQWSRLARRTPLLLRWLATIGCGALAARVVFSVPRAGVSLNQDPGAFMPELMVVLLGLAAAMVLLPAPAGSSPGLFGRQAARLVALLLASGLMLAPGAAFAYCADSFCCFVTNPQAGLSAVAFLPFLTIPLLDGGSGTSAVIEA